jgi:AraC-like DNA-binding protein
MGHALPPPGVNMLRLDLRPLGVQEVPLLGAYVFSSAIEGLDEHEHGGIVEICYLVSGRQVYHVAGRDYTLAGNDVFVTYPGEVHSTGSAPQSKGLLYWIQITLPTRPQKFLGQVAQQAWPLVRQLGHLPRRHFAGDHRLKRIFENVARLAAAMESARATADAQTLLRLELVANLLEYLLLVVGCAEKAAQPRLSPDLRRVREALEREPELDWSVEDMATRARLSVSRFKAKFKQQFGLPPREYLLRLRVERARELLATGSASITDIAYQLGFSSSQYFATVFKRYAHQRPKDVRKG